VFEGTPAELVAARSTLTGEHLAAFVGGGGPDTGPRPKAVEEQPERQNATTKKTVRSR
jgi:hypothetical protein